MKSPNGPSVLDESHPPKNNDLLTREHRLYQVDFLIRKYGFSAEEIPFQADGNLSLNQDPKEAWATMHPERFPIDINRADRFELLRIPGFGPVSVNRILSLRKNGGRRKLFLPFSTTD